MLSRNKQKCLVKILYATKGRESIKIPQFKQRLSLKKQDVSGVPGKRNWANDFCPQIHPSRRRLRPFERKPMYTFQLETQEMPW